MACPYCQTRPVLHGSPTCGEPACIRAAVWAGRARNVQSPRTRARAEVNAMNETRLARVGAAESKRRAAS